MHFWKVNKLLRILKKASTPTTSMVFIFSPLCAPLPLILLIRSHLLDSVHGSVFSFELLFLIIPCLCLGLNESELAQLEMVTLLCMGDKTHSQLMEFMPEKCGSAAQSRDFEAVLSRVRYFEAAFPPYHLTIHEEVEYYFCLRQLLNNDIAVFLSKQYFLSTFVLITVFTFHPQVSSYRAPNFEASGTMQQGMYIPRDEVWENHYDPIYVLLRAVQRRDFQASLDRFKLL